MTRRYVYSQAALIDESARLEPRSGQHGKCGISMAAQPGNQGPSNTESAMDQHEESRRASGQITLDQICINKIWRPHSPLDLSSPSSQSRRRRSSTHAFWPWASALMHVKANSPTKANTSQPQTSPTVSGIWA